MFGLIRFIMYVTQLCILVKTQRYQITNGGQVIKRWISFFYDYYNKNPEYTKKTCKANPVKIPTSSNS